MYHDYNAEDDVEITKEEWLESFIGFEGSEEFSLGDFIYLLRANATGGIAEAIEEITNNPDKYGPLECKRFVDKQ